MLSGRKFETLSLAKIGPANLITDYTGVLTYTTTIDFVLKKYFKLLTRSGRILLHAPFKKTFVRLKNGQLVTLEQWLSRLIGVHCVVQKMRGQFSGESVVFLKRARGPLKIPKLKLKAAKHDFYLYRYFEEV